MKEENTFCSTLVDRIVTGYPRAEAADICAELGYEDNLIDTGEIFGFWVIEGPQSIKDEFPVDKADLPILITDNHKPYKQRKVRNLKWCMEVAFEDVLADVKQRDYQDTHRAAAPLKQAEDAVLLDTSDLNFEQSLAAMKKIIAEKVN